MLFSDWVMRRLLSVNRDAATKWFDAPDDGRKWTISALAWRNQKLEAVAWIDSAFWPKHCEEAYNATMAGESIETKTLRAKIGAARVILKIILNWGNLPIPKD
jgi:hypothetical protein